MYIHDCIKHYQSIQDIKESNFNLILFAVKPQVIKEVCSDVLKYLNQTKPFSIMSILAGTRVKTFEGYFKNSPVIRSMPNLAVSEGSGLTALYSNSIVNKLFKSTADKIFNFVDGTDFIGLEDLTFSDLGITNNLGDTVIFEESSNKILFVLDSISHSLIDASDFIATDFA